MPCLGASSQSVCAINCKSCSNYVASTIFGIQSTLLIRCRNWPQQRNYSSSHRERQTRQYLRICYPPAAPLVAPPKNPAHLRLQDLHLVVPAGYSSISCL